MIFRLAVVRGRLVIFVVARAFLVLVLLAGCTPVPVLTPEVSATAVFQPGPTGTPFRPVRNTALPTMVATVPPEPVPTISPSPVPDPFSEVDWGDSSKTIRVKLAPMKEQINHGRPVEVSFRPGWPCTYWYHRACINRLEDGRVTLATVHSGVGGDADRLRDELEGTGLNRASYPLQQVADKLSALVGGDVFIEQGDWVVRLRVLAAARVPAGEVEEYFSTSPDQALHIFPRSSPVLSEITADRPLLVIETCGWRHSEDPFIDNLPDTSGSVYLIVIGE